MNARKLVAVAIAVLALSATASSAQTLRIAMTASDIPTTGGIPDTGAKGIASPDIRFTTRS